ncbi:hypothetical protein [Salinifilum ghardaiensis]
MSDTSAWGSFGADLEQALRAFEQQLARIAPVGRRHVHPEEDAGELHQQRMVVIRYAEALPRAEWPRPVCEHCAGRREVEAVQARHGADGAPSGFDTARRMCPRCWGTGLVLNSSGEG